MTEIATLSRREDNFVAVARFLPYSIIVHDTRYKFISKTIKGDAYKEECVQYGNFVKASKIKAREMRD